MAISFRLHSEVDVLMDTVQVGKEVGHLALSMGPDDECVVHVSEPA